MQIEEEERFGLDEMNWLYEVSSFLQDNIEAQVLRKFMWDISYKILLLYYFTNKAPLRICLEEFEGNFVISGLFCPVHNVKKMEHNEFFENPSRKIFSLRRLQF